MSAVVEDTDERPVSFFCMDRVTAFSCQISTTNPCLEGLLRFLCLIGGVAVSVVMLVTSWRGLCTLPIGLLGVEGPTVLAFMIESIER